MKALAITMIIVSIILCVAILALTIPFIKKALDDTKTTSKVLKIVFGVLMSLFAIDVVVNAFMQTVLTPFMLGFEVYALTVVFPTWKVFVKKGKAGWASLIPIYREVVIWQITELPLSYLLIGLLLPFANIFFMISIYMSFAQKYNRSRIFGLGLLVLPFIFMPILAFTKDKKEVKKDGSALAAGILLLILSIFVIVAVIPWESLFTKFTLFSDFNSWLGNSEIFRYLIGAPEVTDTATASTTGVIKAIGSWGLADVSVLLILISFVVMTFSNVKLNDFLPKISEKTKESLPVALISIIVSIPLIILVTSGVNLTIVNWFTSLSSKFNVVTTTIASIFGTLTTSDFYYYISIFEIPFKAAAVSDAYLAVVVLNVQAIYYLLMIAAPTSVGLLVGLYALDIPYGKWLKYIWKVLLTVFLIIIVATSVLYLLVAKQTTIAIVVAVVAVLILCGTMILVIRSNKK